MGSGKQMERVIRKVLGTNLDIRVFYGATLLVLPFILVGGLFPDTMAAVSNRVLGYLTQSWSWLYLTSVSLFAFVCLVIALSPFGKVRLGRDDEKPEHSRLSWFSMLFSAGMGIGLVFWAIAEPIYHFTGPPTGTGSSPASARLAFEIFFFHWGIHAWGTYVAVGLPLAYFQFRRGKPGVISQCIAPLFGGGDALGGKAGTLVDILAVWTTIMGVVTSLGLGALQITSGLAHSAGIPGTILSTTVIISVITILFIVSALSGVKRGIKFLSLLNVTLMLMMLVFFALYGPFGYLVRTFLLGLGDYLRELLPLSTSFTLFDNPAWTRTWTVFYWAWWIAWAPFVGAFIATISRGRTIREFVLVVMVVPVLFSFIFASFLGGTAIHLELFQGVAIGEIVSKSVEVALFETLKHLPFYGGLAFLANVLIASFFITSADSATYVITRFSTGGRGAENRQVRQRLIIFWGVLLGGLAVVLIYSGGLKALQTASIVGAFPFIFVMYMLLAATIKDLFMHNKPIKKNI
jgi:glycine betaine transporter